MDLIADILFFFGYSLVAWQTALFIVNIIHTFASPRAKEYTNIRPGLIGLSLLIVSYIIQGIMIATA